MTKEMARVLPKMVKVDIADDLEGHILARDVLTAKGAVLLTRGQCSIRISWTDWPIMT